MKYENTFAVINNKKSISKVDGKQLNTLTITRIADRKDYKTYIQPHMRNHRCWRDIIELSDLAHFIEIPNWTVVKQNIIDADCQPILHGSCSHREMNQILKDKWREEDLAKQVTIETGTGNPLFDSLFEIK